MCIMISEYEAVRFAENILKVPDVLHRSSLKSCPLVGDIVRAFHLKIPFQNISLLSQPVGTQHIPSLNQIKEDVFNLVGGLCYTNNVFMHHLLAALGYQVELLSATCNPNHPDNHIFNWCHCPGDDKSVLVDVGCGYPTYEPIPIDDHTVQTPVYTSGFQRFCFHSTPSSDSQVFQRLHAPLGCSGLQPDVTWSRFYDFSLTTRDLDFFIPPMTEVYEDRFLKKFRLVLFDESGMTAIKEKGNGAVLLNIRDGEWKETAISGDMELNETIKTAAPFFDDITINNAIKHWKQLSIGNNG